MSGIRSRRRNFWNTGDEKRYIDELGVHCLNIDEHEYRVTIDDIKVTERAQLLINYAKSIEHRVDWGSVDKVEIFQYIKAKIDELNARLRIASSRNRA